MLTDGAQINDIEKTKPGGFDAFADGRYRPASASVMERYNGCNVPVFKEQENNFQSRMPFTAQDSHGEMLQIYS